MSESLANNQEAAAPEVTTISQKDAVLNFALEATNNGRREEGASLRSIVTKEVRKAIRQRLFAGVKDGSIKLSRSMDDSKLKKYCSSLINNWLKKDPRFN
jgi:hypothetical protein